MIMITHTIYVLANLLIKQTPAAVKKKTQSFLNSSYITDNYNRLRMILLFMIDYSTVSVINWP